MKMKLIIISLVFFISVIELSKAAYSSEVDAKIFVQQSSDKLFQLYDKLVEKFYLKMDVDNIDPTEAIKKLTMLIVEVKKISDISKEAQKFDLEKIYDSELKKDLKELSHEANILILEEEFFGLILKNLISLDDIAQEKIIPIFEEKSTMNEMNEKEMNKIAFLPEVKNIFVNSKNNKEIEYYWKSWKNISSQWALKHFPDMLAGYKKAASLLNISVLNFWYNFYGDENFLHKMENVMSQIKPLYQQLHAYIRNQLYKKYGEDVVSVDAPIPAHLVQQVVLQTWTDNCVVDFPYKELKMPNYDNILQSKHINDAKKLLNIAENFYQSLNFSTLSHEFWDTRVKEVNDPNTNKDDCMPKAIVETTKTYMKYCKKVNFYKLLQYHRELGKIHYAEEMRNLPAYYFDSSPLSNALSNAVILSVTAPKHLETIELISDYSNELSLNRNFQMGLQTLFSLTIYFVENKVMHNLLNGSVTIENVNKYYWKLMDEYAGIEPPIDRPKSAFDLPKQFYDIFEEENRQTRDFVSEILGYQLYETICKKMVIRSELQNCDFYGSKNAGKILRNIMRLGVSQPFEKLISVFLPQNSTLNAESLLNYFSPLQNFLLVKNKEDKAKIGWSSSQRKVD